MSDQIKQGTKQGLAFLQSNNDVVILRQHGAYGRVFAENTTATHLISAIDQGAGLSGFTFGAALSEVVTQTSRKVTSRRQLEWNGWRPEFHRIYTIHPNH